MPSFQRHSERTMEGKKRPGKRINQQIIYAIILLFFMVYICIRFGYGWMDSSVTEEWILERGIRILFMFFSRSQSKGWQTDYMR